MAHQLGKDVLVMGSIELYSVNHSIILLIYSPHESIKYVNIV